MSTTVQFDLGGSTLDLNDQSNYALLSGQEPQTGVRKTSRLGGGLPYVDLETVIPIRVFGTTPANALAALGALQDVEEQVSDWKDGEAVSPVIYKYQPHGSALGAALQAVVLGPHRPGQPLIVLPKSFNRYIKGSEINPVYLRFLQRAFLGASESKSSSGVTNPGVMSTASFTAHGGVAAVYDLALSGFDNTTHSQINPGLILVANAANRLKLIQAESIGNSTGWTNQADTTNHASSGSVKRFTATSTTKRLTLAYDLSSAGFNTNLERVAVAVTVRNNSAKTFFLRFYASTYGDDAVASVVRKIDPTAYSSPQALFLGYASVRNGVGFIWFEAWVDDATGSPTMDIDVVAVMDGGRNGHVLRHGTTLLSAPFVSATPGVNMELRAEHRLLSDRVGFVGMYEDGSDNEKALSYKGEQPIVMTGDDAAVLWLSPDGSSWVDGGASPTSVTATLTRRPIYTVPQ